MATETTATAPELCAARTDVEPPGEPLLPMYLESCLAPPNEGLTGEWCSVHPDAELCASLDDGGDGSKGCACSLPARSAPHGMAAVGLGLVVLARRRRRR